MLPFLVSPFSELPGDRKARRRGRAPLTDGLGVAIAAPGRVPVAAPGAGGPRWRMRGARPTFLTVPTRRVRPGGPVGQVPRSRPHGPRVRPCRRCRVRPARGPSGARAPRSAPSKQRAQGTLRRHCRSPCLAAAPRRPPPRRACCRSPAHEAENANPDGSYSGKPRLRGPRCSYDDGTRRLRPPGRRVRTQEEGPPRRRAVYSPQCGEQSVWPQGLALRVTVTGN